MLKKMTREACLCSGAENYSLLSVCYALPSYEMPGLDNRLTTDMVPFMGLTVQQGRERWSTHFFNSILMSAEIRSGGCCAYCGKMVPAEGGGEEGVRGGS